MEKEEFLNFLSNARKRQNSHFTKEEREKYENWLDELIFEAPRFESEEMITILKYIHRSIRYLTDICARNILKYDQYSGCMENLLFLMNYLLHYHFQDNCLEEYLKRFETTTMELDEYTQSEKEKIERYYANNEVREKIHFYMEYYYAQ